MPRVSSKRQRTKQCLVRLTEDEYARVQTKADQSGMACAAFLRATALGDAGPRAQRRPPVDHVILRQALGELGRVGNNLNQIARRLNADEQLQLPQLGEALVSYLAIRNAIFESLGMHTGNVPLPSSPEASRDNQGLKPRRP